MRSAHPSLRFLVEDVGRGADMRGKVLTARDGMRCGWCEREKGRLAGQGPRAKQKPNISVQCF